MIARALITADQARAARKLLGWGTLRVARDLQITRYTLERAESSKPSGALSELLSSRLRKFYEAGGVEFFDGVDGPDARMSKISVDAEKVGM